MPQFTVNVSKTIGTVTSVETAAISVTADNDAAARRLALEQLADDAGDVKWQAVPASSSAVVSANGNTTAHITSVQQVTPPVATK